MKVHIHTLWIQRSIMEHIFKDFFKSIIKRLNKLFSYEEAIASIIFDPKENEYKFYFTNRADAEILKEGFEKMDLLNQHLKLKEEWKEVKGK